MANDADDTADPTPEEAEPTHDQIVDSLVKIMEAQPSTHPTLAAKQARLLAILQGGGAEQPDASAPADATTAK